MNSRNRTIFFTERPVKLGVLFVMSNLNTHFQKEMGEIQILLEQEKVSSLVPGMGIGNMGLSELGSKSLKT